MPTRSDATVGTPCWIELSTSDLERSTAFYRDLFGWEAEAPVAEFGGYVNYTKDGVRIAGCMPAMGEGPTDVWSVYLTSDDATKTAEAAGATGAQIHVPPMAVGDLGTMVFLSDPCGAAIGAWQPGLHQGFGVLNEPGTPGWFELHTPDYDQAVAFYRDVFQWDTHTVADSPGFRYTTFGEDKAARAGIMDTSAFAEPAGPARWHVYFRVADTDAAVAKVVALGGAVTADPQDSPYGRLASVTDATGTAFKFVA